MGKIVAIGNEKGGVGKTTSVINLAYYFSHVRNKKVLVVDMDPQCNLTDKYFDQDDESKAKPASITRKVGEANVISFFDEEFYGKPVELNSNLHIFGATFNISSLNNCTNDEIGFFADNINKLSEQYDYVFIDTAPSVGNLQYSALIACDGLLIPTTAEEDSFQGVSKILKSVARIKNTYGLDVSVLGMYLNMVKKVPTQLQDYFATKLSEDYGDLVFKTQVIHTTRVSEASAFKQSIIEYDAKKAEYININALMQEFELKAEALS